MKIIAYTSSPHKQGASNRMLEQFIGKLEEIERVPVQRVDLFETEIGYCRACNTCRSNNLPGYCVLEDGMTALYPGFIEADAIVFVSPVNNWNMSAPMKGFLDRLYALNFERNQDRFANKKVLVLMSHSGKDAKESGSWIVDASMKEICGFYGIEYLGLIGKCSGSESNAEGIEADMESAAKRMLGR